MIANTSKNPGRNRAQALGKAWKAYKELEYLLRWKWVLNIRDP
jgi:hypothetical protein